MSVARPLAGFVAGILLVAGPLSSFALPADPIPGISSYQTGNKALDGMFSDYERSVRSKGDGIKLSNFLRESSGFRNGKISETLRDEMLANRVDSVSKHFLANEVPSGITTEQGRKSAMAGLL